MGPEAAVEPEEEQAVLAGRWRTSWSSGRRVLGAEEVSALREG